jgi:hypothetical protein
VFAFTSSHDEVVSEPAPQDSVKLLPRTPKPIRADDNVGKGMDLALVTLVFLGLGWLLDRWLDTQPLFMILLTVVALVGQFAKLWFDYDATMRQLEAERAERAVARPRAAAPTTHEVAP